MLMRSSMVRSFEFGRNLSGVRPEGYFFFVGTLAEALAPAAPAGAAYDARLQTPIDQTLGTQNMPTDPLIRINC